PLDRRVRVRSVQSHGTTLERAAPGARVAVALAGVDRADVPRGTVLVAGDGWVSTTVLRANVHLVRDVDLQLTARTRVRVICGTQDVSGRIVTASGARVGATPTPVRIVTDTPVIVRAGDRLVLRRPSPAATIGGGV